MKRHPSRSLLRDPKALLYCFDQTTREVHSFAKTLTRDTETVRREDRVDRTFYDHFLERSARVTLLGYSMGGLQALCTFLRWPGLFHRCILINSGVNVLRLNPKPVGISSSDWAKMTEAAQAAFDSVRDDLEEPELLGRVLFGSEPLSPEHARDILFVSGGADDVADATYLQQLATHDGLTVLEIAGLGHPLQSPVFDRYFPSIVDVIERFVIEPKEGDDNLAAEDVLTRLRTFRIGNQRWDQALRAGSKDQGSSYLKKDNNLPMDSILDRIVREPDRFMKYYIMSKRYFQDDAELLRALEREHTERRTGPDRRVIDLSHEPERRSGTDRRAVSASSN